MLIKKHLDKDTSLYNDHNTTIKVTSTVTHQQLQDLQNIDDVSKILETMQNEEFAQHINARILEHVDDIYTES